MRVAVVGQGYVGATLAQAAALAGHEVIGIDRDATLVGELNQGISHVPGVDGLSGLIASGKYRVTPEFSAISDVEIVVIAVPTPLGNDRKPDLSFLKSAVSDITKYVKPGTLVINESTSFPGTLRELIAKVIGTSALFAAAPERVDPGNTTWNTKNTPRLIGGLSKEATDRALNFYRSFCDDVREVSSPEVAEAAKLFENTFRQVNIALVNEFAQVASALGISTFETLNAAASKPFGFMSFTPSAGVGGHCIPVDPSYLSYAADRVGVETKFINLANQVNLAMPEYLAARIVQLLGGSLKGKTIQIAGIAYKSDLSDTRESPALALMKVLRSEGADVTWCDDHVQSWNGEASQAIKPVNIGIIVTAHSGVDYGPWKNEHTMVIDVSTASNTGWPKFL